MRPWGRGAGLTLVELLVAITILAVGLLGILAVHTSALGAARREQRRARAEALADSRLEELGTLDVATLEESAGRADTRVDGLMEARVVHTVSPPPGAPDDLVLLTVEASVGRPGETPERARRQQLFWRAR